MKTGIAIQDYQAQYLDPIIVHAGDRLALGRRDAEFPGWVWCTDGRGKSGWVPERIIESHGETGLALSDYSAIELSVRAGEQLALGELESGWYWAANQHGQSGWVPERNIEILPG